MVDAQEEVTWLLGAPSTALTSSFKVSDCGYRSVDGGGIVGSRGFVVAIERLGDVGGRLTGILSIFETHGCCLLAKLDCLIRHHSGVSHSLVTAWLRLGGVLPTDNPVDLRNGAAKERRLDR